MALKSVNVWCRRDKCHETLPLDRQDVEDLIMHFDEAALAWCQLPPAMAMTNVVRTRSDLTSMLKIRRASIEDTPTVLNLVPRLIAFGPPEWRDPEEMSRADFEVIEKALQSTNDDHAIDIAKSEIGRAHV